MIWEHQTMLRRLLILLDLAIVCLSFLIGYYLRNILTVYSDNLARIYPLQTYINLLLPMLIFWSITLYAIGSYQSFRVKRVWDILWDILKAFFIVAILFGYFAFLFKLHYLSRIFIILSFALTAILLSAERIVILGIVRYVIKKGYDTHQVLIMGTGPRAQEFIGLVQGHPEWGYKITGLVDKDPALKGKTIMNCTVLGTLKELPDLLNKVVVDDVVVIVPRTWLADIEDSILYCEQLGKQINVAVDLFNLRFAKSKLIKLHHFPLLTFETTSDKLWQLLIKRILDFILALIGLILVSPILLLSVILIKTGSNGPVIFKQVRCGLNGRLFTVYKFRTMVVDAEARLDSLRKKNEMSGPAFKMTNDPRITKFGRWMRKFSIDELPQLLNILEGNMSIVGPRPPIPAEVKHYKPWQMRRLSMRPGLTCIWQVQGRNKVVKFDEWMKLDLQYIDNWSLWLDFILFLKTIPVVLFGIGAK
ncbi:MAG: sugar transferase [Candidatus Omnitrophica bacterium]|nr:sugar transferase [Candidatus Omnitrophota bacterium]MDD5672410.1 sugar transferase [Candidatus Omnitrophota bacterium]